ncbi:MAG: glutamyl-tRNA reductase [Ferruginibacter sp.]
MQPDNSKSFSHFYVAGINYKKTEAAIRGKFSVNQEQYLQLISNGSQTGITDFFVLSTCNRMEIYGFAEKANDLSKLVCSVTEGDYQGFDSISYIKNGWEAITHLFHVASGLDSQILGDYEIMGQLKQSVKFSKQHNCLGSGLERILNETMQASKEIKTNTGLSSGTVSVSFAAVQYIRHMFPGCINKNILILGTGKIGSNTCKNIVDYLPGNKITLMNRSNEKAMLLAKQFHLQYDEMENLQACIDSADVIVVATNADEPIITNKNLHPGSTKLLIDLSVPCNIANGVRRLEGMTLVNVDELSKIKDETLAKRKEEVPKARRIIAEHLVALNAWQQMRKHAPLLKAVKYKLEQLFESNSTEKDTFPMPFPITNTLSEQQIQRLVNGMAIKLRTNNNFGCQYINALNDFIGAPVN